MVQRFNTSSQAHQRINLSWLYVSSHTASPQPLQLQWLWTLCTVNLPMDTVYCCNSVMWTKNRMDLNSLELQTDGKAVWKTNDIN